MNLISALSSPLTAVILAPQESAEFFSPLAGLNCQGQWRRACRRVQEQALFSTKTVAKRTIRLETNPATTGGNSDRPMTQAGAVVGVAPAVLFAAE